jgi:release factor glutamine methyltransferase
VSDAPLTVTTALRALKSEMEYDGADLPMSELRMLLAHAMGADPARLTLMAQDEVAQEVFEEARRLYFRRSFGVPMSHIRGYRDFYGRRFTVTDKVLDPRPDTEALIELALREPFSEVLDLGTGSGCILITLLSERPQATGIATDLSTDALQVAEANAEKHAVLPRAAFLHSNWLEIVGGQFDLIVSNPPYIALDEMPDLSAEVHHEPRMALTDEGDGLSAYRTIIRDAPAHLRPGGRLMVEIGPTQGHAVAAMFRKAGLEEVQVRPDLDGRDRVVLGRKPA